MNVDLLNKSRPFKRLQNLIFSLSSKEKNQFRRFAAATGSEDTEDALYIQLFDCINDCWIETSREIKKGQVRLPRQSALHLSPGDEKLLEERIFQEKFVARSRLRSIVTASDLNRKASYLTRRILDCLRLNQYDTTQRIELNNLIADIYILYNKDLFEDCRDMIRKAIRIAENIGALPMLLELYRIERRILANLKGLNSTADLRTIHQKETWAIEKLSLSTSFFDLYQETFSLARGNNSIEKEPIIKEKINFHLDYIKDDLLIQDEIFEVQLCHHSTLVNLLLLPEHSAFFGFLKSKNPFATQYQFEKIIQLYEKYPVYKTEEPYRYMINVINYLSYSYAVGKYVDIQQYREVLDRLDPADPDYLRHIVFVDIIRHISKLDFLSAQKLLDDKKVWELMQKFGKDLPASRRQVIVYNAGLVYFVREDYTTAMKWYELNHNDTAPKSFVPVLAINELFYQIVRLELGRTKAHRHKRPLLDTLEKYLGKDHVRTSQRFEQFIFDTLLEFLESDGAPARVKELAARYLEQGKNLLEAQPQLSHFSLYLAWLESKALARPIRSLVDKYM